MNRYVKKLIITKNNFYKRFVLTTNKMYHHFTFKSLQNQLNQSIQPANKTILGVSHMSTLVCNAS